MLEELLDEELLEDELLEEAVEDDELEELDGVDEELALLVDEELLDEGTLDELDVPLLELGNGSGSVGDCEQPAMPAARAAAGAPESNSRNSRRRCNSVSSAEFVAGNLGSVTGHPSRAGSRRDSGTATGCPCSPGANGGSAPPVKYSSIRRITSSAVIMSMHRGSGPTGSTQSSSGASLLSPSPSACVRDFQQPPLSQHLSAPTV